MATSTLHNRHWVYLDDARTHEVHAQLESRSRDLIFSTLEFPAGSREAAEALIDERILNTAEQFQALMKQLEERLSVSGTYYRADVNDMKWSLVAPLPQARRIDMRSHELPLPDSPQARMGIHHFHAGDVNRDRLLVTLPRADIEGGRSILAQLDFDFPNVSQADVNILHPRLAPSTLKSQLAKHHMDLPTQGYAKLIEPRDYERAFGSRWLDRTKETFRLAAHRVLSIRTRNEPDIKPEILPVPELDALKRALDTERVALVRSLYLAPGESDLIFTGGELAIRRYVQQRRRRVDHHQAFDLSILEASLLVEYGLKSGRTALLAEEGPRLIRYARA